MSKSVYVYMFYDSSVSSSDALVEKENSSSVKTASSSEVDDTDSFTDDMSSDSTS